MDGVPVSVIGCSQLNVIKRGPAAAAGAPDSAHSAGPDTGGGYKTVGTRLGALSPWELAVEGDEDVLRLPDSMPWLTFLGNLDLGLF